MSKFTHSPHAKLPKGKRDRLNAAKSAIFTQDPDEVDRFLNENVKNLADAKAVLKLLILATGVALKKEQL